MEPPQNSPQIPAQPLPKKNDAAFSLFGKIALAIIIIALLVAGGYFLGTNAPKREKISVSPTAIPTPTLAAQQELMSPKTTDTISMTPAATKKTITAGQTGSTIFGHYSVDVPSGWVNTHDSTSATDKLILSKDGFSLTIYQAAFGGGGCLYKGDPPTEMAQTFSDFVGITGKSAQFRRSWNTDAAAKTISYTVCQQNTADKSFGSITSYGRIDAVAPNPSDNTILTEMDSIIASLIKS